MGRLNVGARALAVGLTVGLVGCSPGRPFPVVSAVHLYVFVDQSASPSSGQGPRWRQMAGSALSRLKVGDAVSVFALSDHTADAAALFHRATDVLSPGAGVTRTTAENEKLVALRRDAIKAVGASLDDPRRAQWTDVFAAWGRVEPDPNGRKVIVLLLTDGVHSTREQDLERARLRPAIFPDVVRQAAGLYHWTNVTLAGVDVAFVLNSLDVGAKPPVIDRQTLRSFYETLVTSLGGRLVGFDTALHLEKRS